MPGSKELPGIFDPRAPDWTPGRAMAFAGAQALANFQVNLARRRPYLVETCQAVLPAERLRRMTAEVTDQGRGVVARFQK